LGRWQKLSQNHEEKAMKTTQMILWLSAAMVWNGGTTIMCMAADVIEHEGGVALIKIPDGVFSVAYVHSYTADSGDVGGAVGLVNESNFIDLRQNIEA
jgi:hypothetical protein